jgi:Arc/MetJ-type ribon-helix-helix transcriptional regulator
VEFGEGTFLFGVKAMEITIKEDLREFVREQVEGGRFPTEDAVVEAALERFRGRGASPDDWIDDEFLAYCAREGDDRVIIEERADRI